MDNHPLLAYSTLAATASSAATTITLASATHFPDPATVGAYNIAIWPASTKPTKSNAEIVRVTAKASNVLTVTRAQEASTAQAFAIGDEVAAAITPKALTDIETAVAANATAISDHLADTVDAHDASAISLLDSGNQYAATDVETALDEIYDLLAAHIADTTDAHAGSAITNTAAGNISSTTVQAAINELDSEKPSKSFAWLTAGLGA